MVNLLISYLLLFGVCNTTKFFQQGNDIKCCKPNEVLTTIGIGANRSLNCKYDEQKTLNIKTAAFQRQFPEAPCVDVLQTPNEDQKVIRVDYSSDTWKTTTLNSTYLPKCCPIYYAYDPLEHKCTESTSRRFSKEFVNPQLNRSFTIVKPGMGKCRSVIADYEFSSLQEILKNINNNFSLNIFNENFVHGDYCFDEVRNSYNFVLRICHADFKRCRMRKNDKSKVKCVRKCCPDGKYYKNKRCEDNLYQGFNFVDTNDAGVKDPKEPFAIIVPMSDCHKYMSDEEDEYYMDEKGHISFTVEDNPPLHYSPFKESYCLENVMTKNSDDIKMKLFVCLSKDMIPTDLEEDN